MLDIPQEETKKIKADRVNLRLKGKLKQDLENFCNDKKINSRSKVCKEALNFCLNNESEIDFEIKSQNELKPTITEIKKEVKLPNYIPGYHCSVDNCSDNNVHLNKDYTQRASAYCSNCGQFAREVKPRCAWCWKDNTMLPLQDWYLDKIGIPYPNYDLR